MAYALPSWLETHPDDIANKFVSGVQIGAQLGEARNKLAQQAQQSAVENQITQDKLAASTLEQAQQLKVQQAYNDQQISLKQQQVEAAQQKVQNETLKAARMFQAQQGYQKDLQSGLDMGLPQDEAVKASFFKNLMPVVGGTAGASAIRGMTDRSSIPQTMDVPDIGGKQHRYIYRGPGSTMHEVGGGSSRPDFFTQKDYSALTDELKGLKKEHREDITGAASNNATMKAAYQNRANRIQDIGRQLQQMRPGGSAPPSLGAPGEGDEGDFTVAPGAASGAKPFQFASAPRIVGAPSAAAPAAQPTTQAAPVAAAPAIDIPGLPARVTAAPVVSGRGVGAAERQAKEVYASVQSDAAALATQLRQASSGKRGTNMTDAEYNSKRSELANLLSKLTPADRKAITGE